MTIGTVVEVAFGVRMRMDLQSFIARVSHVLCMHLVPVELFLASSDELSLCVHVDKFGPQSSWIVIF